LRPSDSPATAIGKSTEHAFTTAQGRPLVEPAASQDRQGRANAPSTVPRGDEPILDGMSVHAYRGRASSAEGSRRRGSASSRPPSGDNGRSAASGPPGWVILVVVFVLVVATDQASKWLTWRHFDATVINDGGYILLGSARSWFARPVPGAVANLVGVVLITIGLAVLLRRPRRPAVTVGAGLVAAGWTSNVLDRVGLHEWSAPGSGRGVVDFIPSGGSSRCNLADLWIALGLILVSHQIIRRRRQLRSPVEALPSASKCGHLPADGS